MPRVKDTLDEASLHEAALAYLARYPATAAGLERVLLRRIARLARRSDRDDEASRREAASARTVARTVVGRLVAAGLVDDAGFARARARRLSRSGSSRQRIVAHLAAHGVPRDVIGAAFPDDPARELLACIVFTRRRRIGAFRAAQAPDGETRRSDLAACARAGFPLPLAREALGLTRPEAEERILLGHRETP